MKIQFFNYCRAYKPNSRAIEHYFDLGESGGGGVTIAPRGRSESNSTKLRNGAFWNVVQGMHDKFHHDWSIFLKEKIGGEEG